MSILRNRGRFLEVSLPLLIMIVGTALFYWSDADLQISGAFYDPVAQKWVGNDSILVRLSYFYGPYLSGIIAFWALFNFLGSFVHPRFLLKRGLSLFILLCILVGPVVIVNGVFKETWRRPRPRDTLELGGHHPFQKVLIIKDRSFKGKSFPSGHASSGFVLVLLYFLLKKRRPGLASAALLFGLFWGTWLGFVRIVLGGHFASDVLWAFGLVWYSTLVLFYLWYPWFLQKMESHRGFTPSFKRYLVGLLLLLLSVGALSFRYLSSTPFRIEYPVETLTLPPSVKKLKIVMRAKEGDIATYYGKSRKVAIRTWINGHARPGIAAKRNLKVDKQKNIWIIDYRVEPSGYFYEYQSHNSIIIPKNIKVEWDLFTNQGSVYRNNRFKKIRSK